MTSNMFQALVSKIGRLLHEKSPVVVAISGFGGSGKSYLTDKLRDHFHLDDTQVIRIDHLYGPNPDGPDIFDQTDWALLERILRDATSGNDLHYQGKGFRGEPILIDVPLPKVLLIEGVRLLQPKLMPYFDMSIWIDCPQKVAIERAKARDRSQGEDEATVNLWDTDWGPKDKLYFETYRPDKLASVLYKE